jgi:hypothetical protein
MTSCIERAAKRCSCGACAMKVPGDVQQMPQFQLQSCWRKDLPAHLSGVIDQDFAGRIFAPAQCDGPWLLEQGLRVEPACLNQATRDWIAHTLFEDWLAQLRRSARIEWYWGEPRHTDLAS